MTRTPFAPGPLRSTRRRGTSSVLAMIYLMLFSVMALGFYAQTTVSSQLSSNERRSAAAQAAAESGLHFLRYQLSRLDVPASTKDSAVFEEVYMQLATALDGTGNLDGGRVGYDGRSITIPEDPATFVRLASGGPGFRATITPAEDRLVLKIVGSDGEGAAASRAGAARGILTEFRRADRPTTLFDYGVAARGAVQVKNSAATKVLGTPDRDGSILSVSAGSPAITTGSGPIDGDLFVPASSSQVVLGSGTVGGASGAARAAHVHVVDPVPSFPEVDTTPFKQFATNVYVSGAGVQKNVRVPANTNPTFNAGDVIEGILYIESPNAVEFRGHATVNGIIVFEGRGTPALNKLDFRGNVSASAIPNRPEYADLRAAAKGWAIVAPTASVVMSGGVNGTLEGSVVGHSVALGGSADLTFNKGSVVSLGNAPTLLEGKTVTFNGTGALNLPVTGLRYNFNYRPDLTTYLEVIP